MDTLHLRKENKMVTKWIPTHEKNGFVSSDDAWEIHRNNDCKWSVYKTNPYTVIPFKKGEFDTITQAKAYCETH